MTKKIEVDNFWQGNEACAEAAIAAGCRFFAAYPILPANEIIACMARRMPEAGGVFIQMEDEMAALGSCLGASWAGAKVMTATSGLGLSLMFENIGYAVMTETPCVIVDIQRVGPSAGQPTRPAQGDIQQARWGACGDYEIIALSPWSAQEMYELTIECFNLSERLRVPVFLLVDEAVAHLRENVKSKKAPEVVDRIKKTGKPAFGTKEEDGVPPMPPLGQGAKLLITGGTHDEFGYEKPADPQTQARLVTRLSRKILSRLEEIQRYEARQTADADIIVVAYGFTARSAQKAVDVARKEGVKVGLLRLISIWPFPEEIVNEVAGGASTVIVPEMNNGQIARELKRCLKNEVISISKTDGEVITPHEILETIKRAVK